MTTVTLHDNEQACIHQLAGWFQRQAEGPCYFTVENLATALSVSVEDARALTMTMDSLGLINNVDYNCGMIAAFNVTYDAVQSSRKLREVAAEKSDMVESLQEWVRRNRYTAVPLIAFMAFGTLITVANQAISLAKNLGWM